MTICELNKLTSLSYTELCDYLTKKYGAISSPYFLRETCKTPNPTIKRSAEGLFIHHIKECEFIQLNSPAYALQAPYEYQMGKNLVYCNILEHLLLHMRIVKEYTIQQAKEKKILVGLGGIVNHIAPQIIDYINGYDFQKEYLKTALKVIDGKEKYVAQILRDFFVDIRNNHEFFKAIVSLFYDSQLFDRPLAHALRHMRLPKGEMTHEGRFDIILYELQNYPQNSIQEVKNRLTQLGQANNVANYFFCKKGPTQNYNKLYSLTFYQDNKHIEELFNILDENAYDELQFFIQTHFKRIGNYIINKNSKIEYRQNTRCRKTIKFELLVNGNLLSSHITQKKLNHLLQQFDEE